ncbi:MAG: type II toxin-antitoxin system ParD family antitoxin [Alphaproteobacteria bacterium]|nr:type II toxin-antitoxin system ParD family antitoxin [Alphaproteobacteria bacterium]
MNVSMTPELEAFVHAQVKSGMYQSASELFREAVRLLAHRNKMREKKLAELDEKIQTGLDQIARGEVLTEAQSKKRLNAYKRKMLSKRD